MTPTSPDWSFNIVMILACRRHRVAPRACSWCPYLDAGHEDRLAALESQRDLAYSTDADDILAAPA